MRRLSALLDDALDLDGPSREAWLDALHGDDATFVPQLRSLLARRVDGETGDFAGARSHDVLARGPAFTLPASERASASGGAAPGERIGPYLLQRELGRGGMASVWLAERADGALRRKVALKLPHLGWAPGLVERFGREREILATLEHPNIARLYDAGVDEHGRPWMALEYVEGEPIDTYCRRVALNTSGRLNLLLQVADAVAFAHGRLVLHRDLKPGNLMVTAQGQVRLLDFGIAKLMEGDRTEATALTQLSGRALTLDYASPEQIRGEPLGTASDVYALGVVGYELLVGERPYRLERGSAAELEEAILAAEVPLASQRCQRPEERAALRGDLDAILAQALHKDAASRYPSVDAMAADIRRHLEGVAVSVRPDSALGRAQRWLWRRRRGAALVGAGVLASGLAVGVGATAVVIAALVTGLGASIWQARRAAAERDRALALAERNEAGNAFLETLLARAARGGAFTARELLERSERLVDSDVKGQPDHRAFVLGQLADLYGTVDHWSAALPLLERAIQAAAGGRDLVQHDSLVLRRANAVAMLGRTEEAASTIDGLLARRSLDPSLRWQALWRRGHVAQFVGDFAGVLRFTQQAYEAWRTLPRAPSKAEPALLADLGWAFLKAGRSEEAEDHYRRSTAAFEALGLADSGPAIGQGAHRALAFQEMGDAREAIRIYDELIAASERALPDVLPSLYLLANRPYAKAQIGAFDAARVEYDRCIEQARTIGQELVRFNIRMLVVELEAARGCVDEARSVLDTAVAECPIERPEGGPAQFAHQLAEARLELAAGRPQRALEVYGLALEARSTSAGTTNALLGRAEAHLAAGAVDAAESDARDALAIAVQLKGRRPSSFRVGVANALLARVHRTAGRHGGAIDAARAALPELRGQMEPDHPALVTLLQDFGPALDGDGAESSVRSESKVSSTN